MKNLKVLIVDDEPGIRSGIERVLHNFTVGYPFMEDDFGFETTEAGTGEEALEIIESQAVDIILLDNKLPGIQGIDLLEQINKMQIDSLVMMITSYASLDLAVKATNNGAYNFVPKPFTPQELKSAIENITKHLFLRRMTMKMKEEGKQIRFQFLSVLSHELKSPLNAVDGYLRIMQDKQLGDNIDDYMSMIDRSLIRLQGMRNLIMDMLDLTQIESGKKHRKLKLVNIKECIQLAIHSMEPMAIQRNVKVNCNCPEILNIQSDADELEIIFNNLVSNAVKYNKEGGSVFIDITKEDANVIFRVEDTGIGISPEDQLNLFREFTRIKNSKTQDITGSGLGLSIVKKMVELNKGTISLESEADRGSVFTVSIPAGTC
jgi:two-component system, sensor histidine kinase and response regulator